ncbi:MAG: fumarylacetoacetate hydrolase family protein [bacterium]
MRYQMIAQANQAPMLALIDDDGQLRGMNTVWSKLAEQGAAPGGPPSLGSLLSSPDPWALADRLEAAFKDGESFEAEVQPDVPIRTGDVFCIGRNYAEHARELGNEIPGEPIIFMKPRNCLIASGQPIVLPVGSEQVHHEGEIVLVMGKDLVGSVKPAAAREAVFGVTLMNDVTDRVRQNELKAGGKPWLVAKGQMSFGPCGPAVRRLDDHFRFKDLKVQTHVNGKLRQSGGTDLWIFPLPILLDYLARTFGLRAGDLIATGTPAGVGPLMPGDHVEVSCSAIGVLSNSVLASRAEQG